MGKEKNRTKFQPSSSASAFSQFQNTGFVGFSSGRIPGASLSTLSGDLQFALKKAGKKDSTTKIKAFEELQKLFASEEVSRNIDVILDLWCTLFKDLLLEPDRRVKEIALKAYGVLIKAAGRRVAPYLKRLAGPWLLFMHDNSRPCRTVATQVFKQAIPENKHKETWIFCKNEILEFLSDRFDHLHQTIVDVKKVKGIEAEEIFENNMTASLLSLKYLIYLFYDHSGSVSAQDVTTQYSSIIDTQAFWKLASLTGLNVRCAFLSFLDYAIQYIPSVIAPHSEKISVLFTNALKDENYSYGRELWSPFCQFFEQFPEQTEKIAPKNGRLIKENLFANLRSAMFGAGQTGYPFLARIARALPAKITGEDKSKFRQLLLGSIWKGTESKKYINGAHAPLFESYVNILLSSLSALAAPSINLEPNSVWFSVILKPFKDFFAQSSFDGKVFCSSFVGMLASLGDLDKQLVRDVFAQISQQIITIIEEPISSTPNPPSVANQENTDKLDTTTLEEPTTTITDTNITNNSKGNTHSVNTGNNNNVFDSIAIFIETVYKHDTLVSSYLTPEFQLLVQQVVATSFQRYRQLSYLQFLQHVTTTIPIAFLIANQDVATFYESVLLPNLQELLTLKENKHNDHSDTTSAILQIACNVIIGSGAHSGSYSSESDRQVYKTRWEGLLKVLQQVQAEFDVVYYVLKALQSIDSDDSVSLWRHGDLDTLAIHFISTLSRSAVPLASLANFYSFLLFLLGGPTMTKEGSLVSAETREQILAVVVNQVQKYAQQAPSDDTSFSQWTIQNVAYSIKVLSDTLSSNIISPSSIPQRANILTLFFSLRVDIKYFWKKMTLHLPDFTVSNTSVSASTERGLDDLLIDHERDEKKMIENSPIAHAARYAWSLNISTFLMNTTTEQSDRMAFFNDLIRNIHQQLTFTKTTWLTPSLYAEQVSLLLSLIDHGLSETFLATVLFSAEQWYVARGAVSLPHHLDFFNQNITFTSENKLVQAQKERGEKDNDVVPSYPRLVRFILSVSEQIGVDRLVAGKSDVRRGWIVNELFCAYVLCRDTFIVPVTRSSESDDDWALLSEPLSKFLLDFPCLDLTPVNHSLIHHVHRWFVDRVKSIPFRSESFERKNSENAPSIRVEEVYAYGAFIRKLIHGDAALAEHYLVTYLSPASFFSLSNETEWFYMYQVILPEMYALNHQQCQTLTIDTVFDQLIHQIISKTLSLTNLELLIHFSNVEGILVNEQQSEVLYSIVVFVSEWFQQKDEVLSQPLTKIQLLRFFYSLLANSETVKILVQSYSSQFEFLFDFVSQCLLDVPKQTLLDIQNHSVSNLVLFHACKVAKLLFSLETNSDYQIATESTQKKSAKLYQQLLEIFFAFGYAENVHYLPSENSLYHALSQTIILPLSKRSNETLEQFMNLLDFSAISFASRNSVYYHLLAFPHIGIQKAAFLFVKSLFARRENMQENQSVLQQVKETYSLSELVPECLVKHICLEGEQMDSILSFIDAVDEDSAYLYQDNLVAQLAYLFSWLLVCSYYRSLENESRRRLSAALRASERVSTLLVFLFEYIQEHAAACNPHNGDLVLAGFDPVFQASRDQIICDTYFKLLQTFPSLVRQWWCDDCNRQLTHVVETYTGKYISPQLIEHEIAIVKQNHSDSDEFIIKANTLARQVDAIYVEDEVNLGISLSLPDSYPLRTVEVECKRKVGMRDAQWRQWILSMQTLLLTQDASILDAILLWKNSLDKLFEGIESCLICYSVFQTSNNSLPKLACKTCKNKFHSACLYKWFNTSHKSNCPLCQTPWMD